MSRGSPAPDRLIISGAAPKTVDACEFREDKEIDRPVIERGGKSLPHLSSQIGGIGKLAGRNPKGHALLLAGSSCVGRAHVASGTNAVYREDHANSSDPITSQESSRGSRATRRCSAGLRRGQRLRTRSRSRGVRSFGHGT